MKIKELPLEERPRERLFKIGKENLSNEELLAIILKTGTKNKSVKDIAHEILEEIHHIDALENITFHSFKNIKGIGKVKISEIMAALELGKRIFLEKDDYKIIYSHPKIIYEDNKYLFYKKKQELFYCLYLDSKNQLIERKLLFMGTLNRSIVHPREIFKEAYLTSASKIICMHNHPSGDITPSSEDIFLTKNLIEIGKLQGISISDHIIMGNDNYYSFYDEKRDLFL